VRHGFTAAIVGRAPSEVLSQAVDSRVAYAVFVGLVAVERLVELGLSRRHAAWSMAQGGVEHGRGHYPVMVVLHVALLAGCLLEPWVAGRPFLPWLGGPALAVVAACQLMRWWCVASLGSHWNTRVITVPGMRLVAVGPYRWLRHPNYAAVVAEGIALPLVHTAWVTAAAFTLVNLLLLRERVRVEDAALRACAAHTGVTRAMCDRAA
jgi:methyltransferase